MRKKAVLKFFGGPVKTALALGVKHQAISQWDDDKIPEARAWRAQEASGGKLRVDPRVYARNGR